MQNQYEILKCLNYINNLLSSGYKNVNYEKLLYRWYDGSRQSILCNLKTDEKEHRIKITDFLGLIHKKIKKFPNLKQSIIEKNIEDFSKTLYVGNVPYDTTEATLKNFFLDNCQNFKGDFKVNIQTYNGKPKGYAYIEFENEDDLSNALKINGKQWYEFNDSKVKSFPEENYSSFESSSAYILFYKKL